MGRPIARNASGQLGIADIVLSLPKNVDRPRSLLVETLSGFGELLLRLSLKLEARRLYTTERIVEIPFVLQGLPRSGRILEVGSAGSLLALQLACLGYLVTSVDIRGYPFLHPNLTCYLGRLESLALSPGLFDCAILVSTIEHIGFGHYGDSTEQTDRALLDDVAASVVPGGPIFVTAPFGKHFEGSWYRVYGPDQLRSLLVGYEILDCRFAIRNSALSWRICKEQELIDVESKTLPINGVALLKIHKASQGLSPKVQ